MSWKRILPVATLFAVGAVAVNLHISSAAPIAPAPRAAVPALDDATIVAIFDRANTFDIETGNLAAKKASNPEVKKLAAMMAHDHTMVRQQGRDLAKKLGVTPTPPKDMPFLADHEAAMKKLNALSGPAFDKAYLEHEVSYHNDVINAINTTLMPAIQNVELKKLVTTVAPAFVAHRDAAQSLLNKMM